MSLANFATGILIFVISVLLGNGIADRYKCKKKFFAEFADFVEYVQTEIDFYNREFSDIITKYIESEGEKDKYFISKLKNTENLRGYEKTLSEFLQEVKKYDKEGQGKYFNSFSVRIKKELRIAEESEIKNAPLIKKLVPLIGIAFFIIIL